MYSGNIYVFLLFSEVTDPLENIYASPSIQDRLLPSGTSINAVYSSYKNDVIQYKLPMIGQYTE